MVGQDYLKSDTRVGYLKRTPGNLLLPAAWSPFSKLGTANLRCKGNIQNNRRSCSLFTIDLQSVFRSVM